MSETNPRRANAGSTRYGSSASSRAASMRGYCGANAGREARAQAFEQIGGGVNQATLASRANHEGRRIPRARNFKTVTRERRGAGSGSDGRLRTAERDPHLVRGNGRIWLCRNGLEFGDSVTKHRGESVAELIRSDLGDLARRSRIADARQRQRRRI